MRPMLPGVEWWPQHSGMFEGEAMHIVARVFTVHSRGRGCGLLDTILQCI